MAEGGEGGRQLVVVFELTTYLITPANAFLRERLPAFSETASPTACFVSYETVNFSYYPDDII